MWGNRVLFPLSYSFNRIIEHFHQYRRVFIVSFDQGSQQYIAVSDFQFINPI